MFADVKKRFDAEITRVYGLKMPDVERFILTHERKNRCIENVCEQLVKLGHMGIAVDASKYDTIIKDFAKLFAKACLLYQQQQLMSESAKQKILTERDKYKEAEEWITDLETETIRNADEIEKSKMLKERFDAGLVDEKGNPIQSGRTTD